MTENEAGAHEPDIRKDNDPGGRDALERAAALDAREEALETREALHADRVDREHELLADADKRDDMANARDAAANQRDMLASLQRLLTSETADADVEQARTAASLDRTDSRADRGAAKVDRSRLTDDESTPPSA